MRRKKGIKWVKEEGRDLEIGGSCRIRGETNRGSDVSCEVVWLLAASSFYGAEKDDGNNPSYRCGGRVVSNQLSVHPDSESESF